LDFVSSTGTS